MDIPLEVIKALDLWISKIDNPDQIYGVIQGESNYWRTYLPVISREKKRDVAELLDWGQIQSYMDWLDRKAKSNFLNINDEWERTFHYLSYYFLFDLNYHRTH